MISIIIIIFASFCSSLFWVKSFKQQCKYTHQISALVFWQFFFVFSASTHSHMQLCHLTLPSHSLWCFVSAQVRSCTLTCVTLTGFDFAVGLLLHCGLVFSHLFQAKPCGQSTGKYVFDSFVYFKVV